MIGDKKITILLAVLLTILLLFLIARISRRPSSVKGMFNDTSNNPEIGGILVHMMNPTDFESIIKSDRMDISMMADCAPENRHTCSAWTYVRKDLPPMVFIIPGTEMPTCGIIIDPVKAWELLTTMGVIDSATAERSCCTNESKQPSILRYPGNTTSCISKMLQNKYQGKYDNYGVYIPNKNKGGPCPSVCDEDDLVCRYNNSGGSINYYDLVNWPECFDGKYDDCFDFIEVDESKVPETVKAQFRSYGPSGYLIQTVTKDCKTCSKPYLCVAKSPPNKSAKDFPIEEDKQFSGYVNSDGSNWTNLYMPKDNPFINIDIMIRQCKFEKKDWDVWIRSLKDYYSKTLSGMNPDNTYKNNIYDWQLANPGRNLTYVENEVNMYVNPDKSSSAYKDENDTFIDSIVGFFYVGTTCDQQLSSLDGVTTQARNTSSIYYNAEDRCNGYYGMGTNQRQSLEMNRMNRSRKAVIDMVKWFNKKYNKDTVGYAAAPDSNSFVNYKSWKNTSVKFENLFRPI